MKTIVPLLMFVSLTCFAQKYPTTYSANTTSRWDTANKSRPYSEWKASTYNKDVVLEVMTTKQFNEYVNNLASV